MSRPSGFVFRLEKTRGASWWAKYRLPDGTQVKRKIGPVWTRRGRPAEGHFTKRLAEDWLRDRLEEVRRSEVMASTAPAAARAASASVSFSEAAAGISALPSRTAAASPRRSGGTATRSRFTCCRCSAR